MRNEESRMTTVYMHACRRNGLSPKGPTTILLYQLVDAQLTFLSISYRLEVCHCMECCVVPVVSVAFARAAAICARSRSAGINM